MTLAYGIAKNSLSFSLLQTDCTTMESTNNQSIVSGALELDDILILLFGAVIQVCPSSVGSALLVSKKWDKNIRKRMLWIKNPLLSHLDHHDTGDIVNYTKLEEYVLELKIIEHEAEITRALIQKKQLEKRRTALIRKNSQLTNAGELKTIMFDELKKIKGLSTADYENLAVHSGWITYDTSRKLHGLSYRQLAVMLALTTYFTAVLPSPQFDLWTGVKHMFKSRQQLDEEMSYVGPISQRKMKATSSVSTIADQGLSRIKIFKSFDDEERKSFKRLYDNTYRLGSLERYSSQNTTNSFHIFISVSWLTFLSNERWIASFLLYEANEQEEIDPIVVFQGSTTSHEITVFDFRARCQGQDPNTVIKELYEFSDEEWDAVPEPKHYHIQSVLSGQKRDFLGA